ncbi:MAG: hypothetical protein ABIQ74_07650 [Chitinophagales bacterium]
MKKSKNNGDQKKKPAPKKSTGARNSKGDSVKDEKESENFPGYPHYPKSDDMLEQNEMVRVPVNDMENLSASRKIIPDDNKAILQYDLAPVIENEEEDIEVSEADITKEDLLALGSNELNSDRGDDEQLKDRLYPVDMTGENLDIPGAELDDANENIGEEDEENNNYSIGGDRHEV